MNLIYNGGHLSAPVDDAFIHLQYGRQIGDGHWFGYNDGDPASSALYPLVLAAGRLLLGLDGEALLAFALLLGILLLAATAALGCDLGRRLAGGSAGLWAGMLIATNGAFVWVATSGMEAALLAALILGSLRAFLHELPKKSFVLTPLLCTAAALTRPEGLIFAAVLSGAGLLTLAGSLRERHVTPRSTVCSGLLCLLPLAAGAGQLFLHYLATGTAAANGVRAKSVLYEPVFYPTEVAGEVASNLLDLLTGIFVGPEARGFLFPGALLLLSLGLCWLALRGSGQQRAVGLAAAAFFALALISVATLGTFRTHHYRYVLPLFPSFIMLAVVGACALSEMKVINRVGAPVSSAILMVALVFSLVALPAWAVRMSQEPAEVREQQVAVGYWLRDNLPPGTRVGLNDAGAMRYYGGHPVVDLVGLTTNGLAEPYRNGPGSIYEALERMEPEQRPDYFAVYPSWFRGLESSGVFGERPVESFTLNRPRSINAGSEVLVFKADWSLARSGDLPRTARGGIRDTLDVGDLASEQTHGYALDPARIGAQPASALQRLPQRRDSRGRRPEDNRRRGLHREQPHARPPADARRANRGRAARPPSLCRRQARGAMARAARR